MTTKISIPAGVVLENKPAILNLVFPDRCSRCDAANAGYSETHSIKYEAGLIRYRQFSKRFRFSVSLRIRLPLCETCYRANFLENPDSCKHDPTSLGKVAHWRSIGITTASLVACLAFVLLMKVIPLPAAIPWIQSLWSALIGLAFVLLAITFGLIEFINRNLRRYLSEHNYNAQLHRADINTSIQFDDPQPDDVAVMIHLQNDLWAEECAYHRGWVFEKIESISENVEAK